MGCSRVEVYDRARYFTVTGRRWPGTPGTVEGRQAELMALCAKLWPVHSTKAAPMIRTGEPVMGADNRVERCKRYIAKCPGAVSGNGGSNPTLRAACECYRFNLSDAEAWAVMRWYNESKCEPVWSEAELAHKLERFY